MDQTVPQAEYLGLTDAGSREPASGTKSAGHYDFSEPDWSEFFDVIKGNGPCNVQIA